MLRSSHLPSLLSCRLSQPLFSLSPSSSLLSLPLSSSFSRRPISLAATEKSEELLQKYIEDRKRYETPSPFKNVTPLHGKRPFDDEDVYTMKSNPNKQKSVLQSERKKDIAAKSNKYTRYTPGYTPANLHESKSTIVNDFLPPGKETEKSEEDSDEGNFGENSDFGAEENPQYDPSQVVSIPIGILEESIEKVASVAIRLKKNEIKGPEAAEQLLDHIKLLLHLRASADGEMGEGDGEEEDGMGEMAERGERGMGMEEGEGEREGRMTKEESEREEKQMEEYARTAAHEEYASAEYWDKRYTKHPAALDWYQSYNNLRPTIRRKARPHHKILVVGCGNSLLSEEMYKDGLTNIENIDVSKVVLNMMEEKTKDLKGMTYKLCDVMNMKDYQDETWDIIIDKGTYDALVHGGQSDHLGHKMLKEVHRVLKKGGSLILVSHGNEEFRRPNFDLPEFGWSIDVQPLRYQETKDVYTYVYTMTKK